jgi:hypothetical protein
MASLRSPMGFQGWCSCGRAVRRPLTTCWRRRRRAPGPRRCPCTSRYLIAISFEPASATIDDGVA